MGHIVFAAPSISSFFLHYRLRKDLLRRGHRVSILCTDRARFTFWREQVSDVDLILPTSKDQFTDHDLGKLATPALRWLEREQPDLVFFHQERTPTSADIQFAARTVGSRTLWTGPGLLAHTMQIDERGIDADARMRRWHAKDYRVIEPAPDLLQASLAHALSGCAPLALPTPKLRAPMLRRRIADAINYAIRGQLHAAAPPLNAWRAPHQAEATETIQTPSIDMKTGSICLLLQDPDDPRVVHDATNPPDARSLIAQAIAAADRIAPDCEVVAVLPDRISTTQLTSQHLAGEQAHRVRLAPMASGPVVAATASATITINHPTATVSLLAGTPVIHLGRALYELPGVTSATTLEALPEAVRSAQETDRPALRRRFLTFLLQHCHVWCSPAAPNHNGMLGLVQAVERCLLGDAKSNSRPLPYRPGPMWPLTTH